MWPRNHSSLSITSQPPRKTASLKSLIAPAVTPGHTIIVMIQNGLNIKRAMFAAFPTNIVLSSVSMINSHEGRLGEIIHEDHDVLYLGAFHNPNLSNPDKEIAEAQKFIKIYGAAQKTNFTFSENVPFARWKKLIFNAVLNPLCAILSLDGARIRLAGSAVKGVVKPAMKEVFETARKLGHQLPENIMDTMIHADPLDMYLKYSMLCDIENASILPSAFD
jgi:ketopantoate reductase